MSDLQSPLAAPIRAFLVHHRALGKRFDTEESALRLLDHYLMDQGIESLEAITPALLEQFLRSRPRTRPRSYNHLLNVLQRLFRWLQTQEMLVPSPLRSRPRPSTSQRIPFLFEPAQVQRLLTLAAQLPDRPHSHRRGITYRMIFALMYALGLRVGEIARLCRQDVDWGRRYLIIRQSKFAKSRWVPFGPHVGQALRDYLLLLSQDPDTAELSPTDPLFSLAKDGHQAIYAKTISRTFQRLLPKLALAVGPGVAPPRLHCLRHSFAVATLLRWYRSGIDPAARLNYLSAFLGHVNPTSTAVYLTITADLLEQASARFERFAAPLAKGGSR
jgi:site-specific recombinase XerD